MLSLRQFRSDTFLAGARLVSIHSNIFVQTPTRVGQNRAHFPVILSGSEESRLPSREILRSRSE